MRILMIFLCFILVLNLSAIIINIPADQPTIQAGIDASVNADTVLVQPGTYFENINYTGKLITIASLMLTTQNPSYISQTIINGNQNGRVVTFENEENSEAILCGFTITNGVAQGNSNWYEDCGGGIYCGYYTNPKLNDLVIIENTAEDSGGGIYCDELNGGANLTNVTICGNSAEYGGGIANCSGGYPSSISLSNVSIRENSAINGGGIFWGGDEIYFDSENRCSIYSNTSSNNLGSDLYFEYLYSAIIPIKIDTFSVFCPTDYYAFPIENLFFDILHDPTGSEANNILGDYPAIQMTNYPNPFNPTTTIEFSIQIDSKIDLSIFNINGQKIKTLTHDEFIKGNHSLIWNGNDNFGNSVSSGVYLYKLKVNGKIVAMKKCLLLK